MSASDRKPSSPPPLLPLPSKSHLHFLCNGAAFMEAMRRRAPTTLLLVFFCILVSAFYSFYLSNVIANTQARFLLGNLMTRPQDSVFSKFQAVREEFSRQSRRVSSIQDNVESFSILLPGWEVLVVVPPELPEASLSDENLLCIFPNNETSPAKFAQILPSSNLTTFKCMLPRRNRRRDKLFQPTLVRSSERQNLVVSSTPALRRWNFLVYESFSTDDDIVLFAKGINNRQGLNRSPDEFRCVFGDDQSKNAVRTAVTSSVQEVFRCQHPNVNPDENRLKVSLELLTENRVVSSLAYYTPYRRVAKGKPKSLLCATTMVYNVGKFLREWVTYHSSIGVDKFILYDNDSDDDLKNVVDELNREGFDVETLFWIWPKTQEAGFSHAALYGKDSCTWMMYLDVDEFLFSPGWLNYSQPSYDMLKWMLSSTTSPSSSRSWGQVSFKCNEFGPSNQKEHPAAGVTQGYTCRSRIEQRHKSIVLLEAVDDSLLNVIHHFKLKGTEYEWREEATEMAVVNHYKYQAWPEFKNKFRRRVSAYVVDWMNALNPDSKDRTPGLGFEPIEPKDWGNKFCEVEDVRLKNLTQSWFGSFTLTGFKMAWER